MITGYPKYLTVFYSLPNFSSLCVISQLNILLCNVKERIKLDLVFPTYDFHNNTNSGCSSVAGHTFAIKLLSR